MSRYTKDVELNQPIDVVSMLMDDFIYHNRFIRADWNGEMVYFLKDSHGKERYMKWYYTDGVFHVEAWLKGSFGNEADLDSMGGRASKREFRTALDKLLRDLKNQSADAVTGGHIGTDPLHHDSIYGTNHNAWETDTEWQSDTDSPSNMRGNPESRSTGNPYSAGSALIFAFLAIILGGCFPVFGIIFAVAALKKRDTGMQSGLVKTMAMIAIIIAAIGFLSFILTSLSRLAFFF